MGGAWPRRLGGISLVAAPPLGARAPRVTLDAMRVRLLVLGALVVVTVACASTAPSDRSLCGRVTVPLDRAGVVSGTIGLRVRALPPSGGGPPTGTVIALAGGPGQAAVPLLDSFASVLRPVLRTRELVTFDQRGTGGSGRLRCAALSGRGSLSTVIGRCATELGARRTTYTTAASVEDLEAVRSALGADKLILYAASYGTKVALSYAARYPQHVDRLVLDSVVPPEGIDPFQRSTLASIPRVLRSVCAGDCRFTRDPGGDVAALARRLSRGALRGTVLDGSGHGHPAGVSEAALLGLLLEGDFDPYLRAALPAAVRGALSGDLAPLLRLTVGAGGAGSLSAGSDSDAVYIATTCQDGTVPWAAGTPLAARRAAVDTAAAAIPEGAFAPFDRATVRALGTADLCRGWPESPIAQPLPSLPATPTLILSGDDDLRTPRLDALGLAGRLPGAHLLEVPDAGHAVLFSDPTDCAQQAVVAFVGGLVPGGCRYHRNVAPALRLAPRRIAEVRGVRGVSRPVGRTVSAMLLTLDDASEQLIEQVLTTGQARPFGGLRAGSAALVRGHGLRLRGYGYVPGVTVTGLVPSRASAFALTVGGREAARGHVKISPSGVTGLLGGQRVDLSARTLGWRSAAGALASAAGAGSRLAPGTALAPLADAWVRPARIAR
jgi:pimeloyl-ACP methyl ester carboxylesterase